MIVKSINKKLEKKIAKRLKSLRKLQYKEYPGGDYLRITIYKDAIMFNNNYWDIEKDKNNPVNYIERQTNEKSQR